MQNFQTILENFLSEAPLDNYDDRDVGERRNSKGDYVTNKKGERDHHLAEQIKSLFRIQRTRKSLLKSLRHSNINSISYLQTFKAVKTIMKKVNLVSMN